MTGYCLYVWVMTSLWMCSTRADQVVYPIKEGNDTGLIIMAGADLTGQQYDALALAIQEAYPERLWVYLDTLEDPSSAHDPQPRDLNNTQVGRGRLALYDAGMSTDAPYYALGHSLGGILVYVEVKFSREDLADGVILLGATMYDLAYDDYPTPVLVINGDLDGMMRPTQVVIDYRLAYETINGGDDTYKYRYPHVMVDGMNHAMYCTGELPELVEDYWTIPEITVEESLEAISQAVNTFFTYDLTNDDEERDVARAQLDQYFTEMDAFVPPFYQALDLQYNASSQDSPWAKMGQVMIADLEAGEESQLNINNVIVDRAGLRVNDPVIQLNSSSNLFDLTTYTSLYYIGYSSATTLESKYKSSQAIREAITGEDQDPQPQVYCRDVDEAVYELVYNTMLSEKARERYVNKNITVIFLDDLAVESNFEWVNTDARFAFNGTHWTMQSVHYTTDTAIADDTSGMHHCKLVSPAMIQEFIYTDVLYESLYFPTV